MQGYAYAREGHPNADLLGRRIDALEGMSGGIVTGSGMAAVAAVLMGLCKAGDHVVGADQLYGRSLRLMGEDLPRLGIATTLADPTDVAAVAAALRPATRLVLIEVVSNPTLRIADHGGDRYALPRAGGAAGGGQHLHHAGRAAAGGVRRRYRHPVGHEAAGGSFRRDAGLGGGAGSGAGRAHARLRGHDRADALALRLLAGGAGAGDLRTCALPGRRTRPSGLRRIWPAGRACGACFTRRGPTTRTPPARRGS